MREIYLCELCELSAGCINLCHIIFFIISYATIYKMLEHININGINLSRGPF